MNKNLIPAQKDKNIFFANANMGIAGSLLAGITGASFYDLVNIFEISKGWRILYSIVFVLLLIIIMVAIKSQIKQKL